MIAVADAKLTKLELDEHSSGFLIMDGYPEDTLVQPLMSLVRFQRARNEVEAARKLAKAGYANRGATFEQWLFEDPTTSERHEGYVWVPRLPA